MPTNQPRLDIEHIPANATRQLCGSILDAMLRAYNSPDWAKVAARRAHNEKETSSGATELASKTTT